MICQRKTSHIKISNSSCCTKNFPGQKFPSIYMYILCILSIQHTTYMYMYTCIYTVFSPYNFPIEQKGMVSLLSTATTFHISLWSTDHFPPYVHPAGEFLCNWNLITSQKAVRAFDMGFAVHCASIPVQTFSDCKSGGAIPARPVQHGTVNMFALPSVYSCGIYRAIDPRYLSTVVL